MQFLAVDLQCDCCCLQWPNFWIFVPVNRGLRLLKMLAGPLRLMDVTLSKRNWSYMRYWYFVDFRRGISVLPIFLTVLRYWVPPPPPPPSVPLFKIWINLKLKRTLKSFHSYKMHLSVLISLWAILQTQNDRIPYPFIYFNQWNP